MNVRNVKPEKIKPEDIPKKMMMMMNIEYDNKVPFESVVEADPTLKFLIRDSEFDFDLLEHQMRVRGAAIVIAIGKWIDSNYN